MARNGKDEGIMIRKGPWMAEEDEILMGYVTKYGPRDWSTIRSKGLLPRTGKSCRLRWVNKLKPDLKTGSKLSAEEERIVIDLQAEFGNKWAKIATYLPGRTDNDVKNLWSTRKKRLARLLQTSPPTKSSKNHGKLPSEASEDPALCSIPCQEESSYWQSSKGIYDMGISEIKMIALPDLINPDLLNLQPNPPPVEFATHFPQTPLDLPLLPESQDLISGFGYTGGFLDMYRDPSVSENNLHFPLELPFFELDVGRQGTKLLENSLTTHDSFFDDFPADMFDHLEPLPNSS